MSGGSTLPDAVLTDMLQRLEAGQRYPAIADALGVHTCTVRRRATLWGLREPRKPGKAVEPEPIVAAVEVELEPIPADHHHRFGPQLYCECGAEHPQLAEVMG